MSRVFTIAIDGLKQRRQKARADYRDRLKFLLQAKVVDPDVEADRLIDLVNAAGLTVDDLERDMKALLPAEVPRLKMIHLETAINFSSGPHTLSCFFIDTLISEGGGQISLSEYQVEPAVNQSTDDAEQLVQTVRDYNQRLPGACPEGVKLLRDAGLPGGNAKDSGSAEWVAGRVQLWRIRKATIEAKLMKSRGAADSLKNLTYARLGLGGCIPAVLTGDANPQLTTR